MYRLLFLREAADRTALATQSPLIFIGRAPSCHLRLLDSGVSDRHAAIERRDDGYYLCDLGASNGVRVNHERVHHHRLSTGDELEIGAVRLMFEIMHPPLARHRRVDLLWVVAVAVVAALVAGHVALLAWIFSTPRPHRLVPTVPPSLEPS